MKTNRILFPIFALLALLPAIAFGASKIIRPIEENFDLKGISKIVVHTQGGYIHIVGESRSDAQVRVEQVFRNASENEADDLESRIEKTLETRGDTLHVEFKLDQSNRIWSFFGNKASLSFNITIATAKEMNVELRTSGGSIEVASLDGFVQARTSGGGIEAREINGDLDLSTSGGRISVASITGQSKLSTSGGGIHADNMKGPLDARTSGGRITASFPQGIDDDTRLKTSGGSITAKLPRNDSFYLVAHTSAGGVRTEFPIVMKGEIKRNQAEGPVNGGGPTLELKTSGGSINIQYL